MCSLFSLIFLLKNFNALYLLRYFVFFNVPAIGLVEIKLPLLVIRFSGEQLIIEKFLSLIKNASGAKLVLESLQKKSNGSILDLL